MGWPVGLRLLLLHGAELDIEDISGLTPVDYGIYEGFAEGVSILVNEGCNVNVRHNYRLGFSFRDCFDRSNQKIQDKHTS